MINIIVSIVLFMILIVGSIKSIEKAILNNFDNIFLNLLAFMTSTLLLLIVFLMCLVVFLEIRDKRNIKILSKIFNKSKSNKILNELLLNFIKKNKNIERNIVLKKFNNQLIIKYKDFKEKKIKYTNNFENNVLPIFNLEELYYYYGIESLENKISRAIKIIILNTLELKTNNVFKLNQLTLDMNLDVFITSLNSTNYKKIYKKIIVELLNQNQTNFFKNLNKNEDLQFSINDIILIVRLDIKKLDDYLNNKKYLLNKFQVSKQEKLEIDNYIKSYI